MAVVVGGGAYSMSLSGLVVGLQSKRRRKKNKKGKLAVAGADLVADSLGIFQILPSNVFRAVGAVGPFPWIYKARLPPLLVATDIHAGGDIALSLIPNRAAAKNRIPDSPPAHGPGPGDC